MVGGLMMVSASNVTQRVADYEPTRRGIGIGLR